MCFYKLYFSVVTIVSLTNQVVTEAARYIINLGKTVQHIGRQRSKKEYYRIQLRISPFVYPDFNLYFNKLLFRYFLQTHLVGVTLFPFNFYFNKLLFLFSVRHLVVVTLACYGSRICYKYFNIKHL